MSDDEDFEFDFEAELAAVQQEIFEEEKKQKEEEPELAVEEIESPEPGEDDAAETPEEGGDVDPPPSANTNPPPPAEETLTEFADPVADPTPPRVVSADPGAPRLTRRPATTGGLSSAKVHPAAPAVMDPLQPLPDTDLERGAHGEDEGGDDNEEPEWSQTWLSAPNKKAKLHAFQQYIQRIEDLGTGPVPSPTPEERHHNAYWLSNRFCDNTTMHGVKNIWGASSTKRRVIWIVCLLVAMTGFAYQVYGTFNEFFKYPKKVTIELLEVKQPVFPSVTICNFNIISLEKMANNPKYSEIAEIETEMKKIRLDCDTYNDDYDTYYSDFDTYDPEEGAWWSHQDSEQWDIEHEYEGTGSGVDIDIDSDTTTPEGPQGNIVTDSVEQGGPDTAGQTTVAPDPAGGDNMGPSDSPPETVEPTFYEMSTVTRDPGPGPTNMDGTTMDGTTGDGVTADGITGDGITAAGTVTDDPSTDSMTTVSSKTAKGGQEKGGKRRKRDLNGRKLDSGTPGPGPRTRTHSSHRTTVPPGFTTGRGRQGGRPSSQYLHWRRWVSEERWRTEPAAPTTSATWAKLVHKLKLTQMAPPVIRARRSVTLGSGADPTVAGLASTPVADGTGSTEGSGDTYYDSSCKCVLRCDPSGCYEFNSLFDSLTGGNKTFRELVKIFTHATNTDFQMLRRAFTPTTDEVKRDGIKSAQFIHSCSFDRTKCHHTDFERWQSDDYGNCFTFNSGFRYARGTAGWYRVSPNKTRSYGSQSGLRVTLNVDPFRYASLFTPDIGVRVLVHAPDQLPFPEEGGFSVLPGFTTTVGVRHKRIARVGSPHGNCREQSTWATDARYTPTACRKRCTEHLIRVRCNCSESVSKALTVGLRPGLPRCNPLLSVVSDRCRQKVKSQFISGDAHCDCPPACEEDRYEQFLSMNLPNKNYYKIIYNLTQEYEGADICDESIISNNTIRLQVFLEDLSYEQITESPAYSLEALVSNIGGLMGLFIGISAMTLAETIEYVIDLITIRCRNMCSKPNGAMEKSGIKRIDMLPADADTGMKYLRVVHQFEVPREHVVRAWQPPELVDRQVSTVVSVPVNQPDNRHWTKNK